MAVDTQVMPKAMEVASAGRGEFSCAACGEFFATAAELRAHCKSERHVYNMKRQLSNLKPISQEAWERKLREREGQENTKGTAHLKAGKAQQSRKGEGGGYGEAKEEEAAAPEAMVFSPRRCLFDKQRFSSVEKNLQHMWKTYSFFVPDKEYCTNVEGLLEHLWTKCTSDFSCLFCNRRFPDAASTRRHMLERG